MGGSGFGTPLMTQNKEGVWKLPWVIPDPDWKRICPFPSGSEKCLKLGNKGIHEGKGGGGGIYVRIFIRAS